MAPLAPFVWNIHFSLPDQERKTNHTTNEKYKPKTKADIIRLAHYSATRDGVALEDIEPDKELDELIFTQYLDERPGSHGLFSQDGSSNLDEVQNEIRDHGGILWHGIISLREDEAIRINHITRQDWEHFLQKSFPEVSEHLNIPESNFRWVAAYHEAKGHPHCHFIFWEKEPERIRGMLSEGEKRDIKKTFIRNIYAGERGRLSLEKTLYRNEIEKGVQGILGLRQELDKQKEIVRAELGDMPGIAPRIGPEQERELNQRMQSLAKNLPGHGRVALGFMPEEVKAEVREIADWLLQQPGFKQEVKKYLDAHTEITKTYTFQESQISQALENAYNDLLKRTSQDILKRAVQVQELEYKIQNINCVPDATEGQAFDFLRDSPGVDHQENRGSGNRPTKEEKEAQDWYRSTFRLVERERAAVITGERLKLPDFTNYQEGLDKLTEIAWQIPDDFKGRPVIAFLPDELKEQVREAADWLLANSDIQSPLRDYLETIQGDSEAACNQIRDRVAENALFHALRLLNREMPNIQMVLHEQRAQIAKEQLLGATADVVMNDDKEAKWTLFKMHEALTKMGASMEEIREIITRWARDAGIESSVDRVLQRTYGGENDIDFMGRANWNRMCDNLGYHEHELLNPWMGQIVPPEEQEQETEPTQQQTHDPITPPDFLPEHVPAILETYDSVIANPELAIDKDELQWTIWTSSWVLKELGVDTQTRLQILNDWVQRSGIEMSQARVADTIHRANLVHEEDEDATPRWLGRDNWERLMRNIGAENPPDRPWEYPAQGFNLAGAIWKGLWQSIQRERTKSEYQARRMEAQREYEEKRRREGRER